jgi:hypothetical protein
MAGYVAVGMLAGRARDKALFDSAMDAAWAAFDAGDTEQLRAALPAARAAVGARPEPAALTLLTTIVAVLDEPTGVDPADVLGRLAELSKLHVVGMQHPLRRVLVAALADERPGILAALAPPGQALTDLVDAELERVAALPAQTVEDLANLALHARLLDHRTAEVAGLAAIADWRAGRLSAAELLDAIVAMPELPAGAGLRALRRTAPVRLGALPAWPLRDGAEFAGAPTWLRKVWAGAGDITRWRLALTFAAWAEAPWTADLPCVTPADLHALLVLGTDPVLAQVRDRVDDTIRIGLPAKGARGAYLRAWLDLVDGLVRDPTSVQALDGLGVALGRDSTEEGLARITRLARSLGAETSSLPTRPARFGRNTLARLLRIPERGQLPRPVRATPEHLAEWWDGHSQQDRTAALERIDTGRLDGLPVDVRDEVNRTGLRAFLEAGDPTSTSMAGALAVSARLHHPGLPRARLLLFDPAGTGRVMMFVGDPTTADHVVLYVPGMLSSLAGAWSEIGRVDDLYRATLAAARPGETVAVGYWQGYDAPANLPEAMSSGPALRGAHDLHLAVRGLRAIRRDRAHVTLVGHSYGTRVAGTVAVLLGLPVDDLAMVASPGAMVRHARELGLADGHVWAGVSFRDPIRLTPRPIHGRVPTTRGYGAYEFDTGSGGWVVALEHAAGFAPGGWASPTSAASARAATTW